MPILRLLPNETILPTTDPAPTQSWPSIILFLFPLFTLFGNVLVVFSVYREKSLRTATNYFIVSLAVADISLAVSVMPMSIWLEFSMGVWSFGDMMCDAFVMLDVLFCTASILNLAAISIDRFMAVTMPMRYALNRNFHRIYAMIAASWIISVAIAAPIACGINQTAQRNNATCTFSNADYILYSSIGSFYVPAIVMMALYHRIFIVIRHRAHRQHEKSLSWRSTFRATTGPSNPAVATATGAGCWSVLDQIPPVAHEVPGNSLTNLPILSRRCFLKNHTQDLPVTEGLLQGVTFQNRQVVTDNCLPTLDGAPLLFGTTFLTEWVEPDRYVTTKIPIAALPCFPQCWHYLQPSAEVIHQNPAPNDTNTKQPPELQAFQECGFHNMHDFRRHLQRRVHEAEQEYLRVASPSSRCCWCCWGRKHVSVKHRRPRNDAHESPGSGGASTWTNVSLRHKMFSTMADEVTEGASLSFRQKYRHHHKWKSQTNQLQNANNVQRKVSARKEKKATKTLAIVLGLFLLCWLPYFTVNTLNGLCMKMGWNEATKSRLRHAVDLMYGTVTWLGYINSFFNPVIYTTFNIDFRRAFRKILCGHRAQ